MTRVLQVVAAILLTGAGAAVANDYPTEARASYVFGCMAVNGQTPEALHRIEGEMLTLLKQVKPDAVVGASAH